MKKQLFLFLSILLFLIQLQAQTIVRGPYLQKASESIITIKWRTSSATQSKIEYGTNLNNLNQTATNNNSNTDHEIEINGLSPATTYFYQVADQNGVLMPASSDLYFKTHPAIGTVQPIKIWVLGDCGTANTNQRNVRDAYYNYIGNDHTDAILMLGDNAYSDGTDSEYQTAVFENMYEDKLKNSILWSCIGNHDGHSANSNDESGPYYDIFTFPRAGESGGLASGTEAYYSFDYGNIHFICLDSYGSNNDVGGPMYVWAENDIQNTTQDWIVAFWHHPAYTKGSHDSDTEGQLIEMRENFVPMLESNGVDLALSGHSHSYERSYFLKGHHGKANTFNAATHTVGATGDGDGKLDGDGAYKRISNGNSQNDGAVYITAGSSGKTSSGSLDHDAMYYSVAELGSCVIEVNGNQMDVKFLRDNENVEDYFTIQKEAINCTAGDPCDDGNPYTINDSYDSDCFCTGTVIGGSTCIKINNGADDVEESDSGNVNATSSDIELVFDGSNQTAGFRFNNVNIPQGATITQAYLQFTVDEESTDVTNLNIIGEDTDDAAPFTSANFELTNRTKTTANVNWAPPVWNVVGASSTDQRTPDLSTIIQEIVSRPGFNNNNSMALFVTGTGTRIAESYEGEPSGATRLCITYTTAGCPIVGQPCDDGDSCTINDIIDASCNCIGTFEDNDNDGVCDANDQCPNFDDKLIGTACDDNDPSTTLDVYTTNCICEGMPFNGNLVCRQVITGEDDAEENASNGNVNTGSSDIEMVFDTDDQIAGLRFDNITIPQGATITNAYIQFVVDETDSGTANLVIHGEDADNTSSFSENDSDLSNRPMTSATVNWSPPDWNTIGEAGPDQQTPDLSSIIQEIIDRPGFNSNNAIVLMVTGTGTRTAEAYEGGAATAPELCIEFSIVGCPSVGQPCNDNDPCTINDTYDVGCNCVGTFQDSDNDTVCDANDQCPNFNDTLIGTACDDNDPNTINDVYTTNCICEGIPGSVSSVCRQISAGIDDVEENTTNGNVNTGSSDIEMVEDGDDQIAGFRFNNITIPQGASITNAYLQFVVDETDSGTANLTIQGEDTDNATTFSGNDNDLSNRTQTSASVNWSPPDWNTAGDAGPDQQTPDLSSIIQEIVNRPGFSQNNSIALFVTGTGKRTAEAYEGDDTAAAELCIEFALDENGACKASSPVVVDGNNSDWSLEDSIFVPAILMEGSTSTPTDFSAQFQVKWDENYLYVFGDVEDDFLMNDSPTAPWDDDGFEIFIDGGNEKATTYDANDHQLIFRYNDLTVYELSSGTNNPIGVDFIMLPGNGGYTVEVRMAWSYIGVTPAAGNKIGLDVHVNDDDADGGVRDASHSWTDLNNMAWSDPSVFGTVTLNECSSTPSLTFDFKVGLEGAYNPTLGTMTNDLYTLELLPGMLFSVPSQIGLETPPGQPYSIAPLNYPGTEGLTYSNSDYDPASVDWVLMSLRTGVDASTKIHQAAGILKRDGAIEFLPGSAYQGNVPGPYYVLIEHRNHIGALSAQALTPQNGVLIYDFTTQNSWVPSGGGFGQKELIPGYWLLYGGDGDQIADPVSYDINGADRIFWNVDNGKFNEYLGSDYNLSGEVTGADRILWHFNSGINSSVPK